MKLPQKMSLLPSLFSALCVILTYGGMGAEGGKFPCPECDIYKDRLEDLTTLYPPRGPLDNETGLEGPVVVNTKIVVKELMEMNVKEETLKIMGWIRLYWVDPRIVWDPMTYGRIHEVRVSSSSIWVPDMLISNSLQDFEINHPDSTFPVIIGFNGLIYWSVPMIIHTKCQADVTYFPFDQQHCRIKMNSWTYHEKLVKLAMSTYSTGMEQRLGNIEWLIDDVTSELLYETDVNNHPLYDNETIRYPYIEYMIALKRKPDFYVNSLVIPSLLLSWLGAVIFLLPNECGEKLGFSITLFLALYVNQVIVAEFLPPSADSFPLIARFYTVISVMLGCSIVLTAATLMLHFRISHEMIDENSLLIKFFLFCENLGKSSFISMFSNFLRCIAHCCLCYCCKKTAKTGKNSLTNGPSAVYNELNVVNFGGGSGNAVDKAGNVYTEVDNGSYSGRTPETPPKRVIADCSPKIEEYLTDIVAKLAIVAKDDAADIALKRWQLIAAGFDKIFFIFYTMTLGAITLYFGMLAWKAKNYHENN